MKKTIVYFQGVFNGIYKWHDGWAPEKRDAWLDFWLNKVGNNCIFWKAVLVDGALHLVGIMGSIYLHPMEFRGGLFDCGVMCNGKYFSDELEELNKLCQECAKELDATFELFVSDEIEVKLGEMPNFKKAE